MISFKSHKALGNLYYYNPHFMDEKLRPREVKTTCPKSQIRRRGRRVLIPGLLAPECVRALNTAPCSVWWHCNRTSDNWREPVWKPHSCAVPLVFLHDCVFQQRTGTYGLSLLLSSIIAYLSQPPERRWLLFYYCHFCIFCLCSLRAISGKAGKQRCFLGC